MKFPVAVAILMGIALVTSSAEATQPPGKCPADTTVIVEIRGVPLLIPRSSAYRLLLDDGKTHLNPGRAGAAGYTCDTPVIKNVRALQAEDFKLGYFSGHNTGETTFTKRRNAALGAPKLPDSTTVQLPSGIIKTVSPKLATEFFALPLEVAPTFDKVPVIFSCDNYEEDPKLRDVIPRSCSVEYLHPSGLPVTYSVLRSDYPTDDFIPVDAARRKEIDGLIAAAKAKKDLENKD